MIELDAAVEDADPDALPGRTAPGPLTGDLRRPRALERNLVGRAGRQAPGGELGHEPMLVRFEAVAKLVNDPWRRLNPLGSQGLLEVGEDAYPELRIRLGARDELIQSSTR